MLQGALFVLPLFARVCAPFKIFIAYAECNPDTPLGFELMSVCYLFGSCGIVRALCGLFPEEWGLWVACMGTMGLEIALNVHLALSKVLSPPHWFVSPGIGSSCRLSVTTPDLGLDIPSGWESRSLSRCGLVRGDFAIHADEHATNACNTQA